MRRGEGGEEREGEKERKREEGMCGGRERENRKIYESRSANDFRSHNHRTGKGVSHTCWYSFTHHSQFSRLGIQCPTLIIFV